MTMLWKNTDSTLPVAAALFAAISVLRFTGDDPADGLAMLYVIPVGLVAIRSGTGWGLAVAALALAVFTAWDLTHDGDVGAVGYVTRGTAFVFAAAALGAASRASWRQERTSQARQIHDDLVQGLTVARYSVEAGDTRQSIEALDKALASARKLVDGGRGGPPRTAG